MVSLVDGPMVYADILCDLRYSTRAVQSSGVTMEFLHQGYLRAKTNSRRFLPICRRLVSHSRLRNRMDDFEQILKTVP